MKASQCFRINSGTAPCDRHPHSLSFLWFGGYSTSKTPDPIPNSAVKCRRANGTASQDVGE